MLSAAIRRSASKRSAPLWAGLAVAAGLASSSTTTAPAHLSTAEGTAPLSPNEWVPLKLLHKETLTHGDRPTILLRFDLSSSQLPFPVASCLLTRLPVGSVKEDGTTAFVLRPYTPVSPPDSKTLDIALKIYPDGKLTPHLATLKPGDHLDFKGPLPKISLSDMEKKKSIGLIAGGTGITPMLQVASQLLRSGYQGQISLIYANISSKDIMLKSSVDELAKKYPNFSVYYVIDKPERGWRGGVGYITADLLSQHLPHTPGPTTSNDTLVCVCGPPPMMKSLSGEKVSPKDQGPLSGALLHLGYTEENVYKF